MRQICELCKLLFHICCHLCLSSVLVNNFLTFGPTFANSFTVVSLCFTCAWPTRIDLFVVVVVVMTNILVNGFYVHCMESAVKEFMFAGSLLKLRQYRILCYIIFCMVRPIYRTNTHARTRTHTQKSFTFHSAIWYTSWDIICYYTCIHICDIVTKWLFDLYWHKMYKAYLESCKNFEKRNSLTYFLTYYLSIIVLPYITWRIFP